MKPDHNCFNLSNGFPNVLLVGNGILKSCADINGLKSNSWDNSIYALSEKILSDKEKEDLKDVPYSLKATILAPIKDHLRRKRYSEVFKTLELKDNALLKNIASLNFNAILTTNYTYEIENCFHPGYSELRNKVPFSKIIERTSKKGKRKATLMLHTYNKFQNSPPIWHIHGEERCKSSMVLSHDEYSRLISFLIEENSLNNNKYIDYSNEVKYKSWLDYFLMSNLYIIGLSMSFSEFDLWWILNRRIREKAKTGKIVFFAPHDTDPKIVKILRSLNVCVKEFDINKNDENYYINFYKEATQYIKNDLDQLKKGVER